MPSSENIHRQHFLIVQGIGTICIWVILLNFSFSRLSSGLSLGRILVVIFMVDLAFAGRWARNTRHVLPVLLNGLKIVVTSVMNFVSMARWMDYGTEQWSRSGVGLQMMKVDLLALCTRSL